MRDQLIQTLYGGLYDASPGSDRHGEQCRRIQEAIILINESEEEMAKKKPPSQPKRPDSDREEKPSSFRDKMVKKFKEDGSEEEVSPNGV